MILTVKPQIDGLLLIDKPADVTSHDVVARVRRALKQKSVGHTGTLDPLATGLMILVLGEATKLSDYLVMTDKSYAMTIRLGVTTDTLDRTGKVLSETPCAFTREQLEQEVARLVGDFQWPVPLFSAAKVDGKKLYEYGRKGQDVAIPMKMMSFWDAKIFAAAGDRLKLSVSCSKGSFIRTWAAQLGSALGVGGVIEELRRLSNGSWSVEQALTLAQLDERVRDLPGIPDVAGLTAQVGHSFVPMSQALPKWKSLMATAKDARLVSNGQVPRDVTNRLVFEQKQAHEQGAPVFVKVVTAGGDLLAILAAEPGQGLKIRRVFRGFT